MNKAFLSLGSNSGDRKTNLARAIRYINIGVGHIIDLSGIYETEPWGFEADTNFLNIVIEIITDLTPHEALKKCLEVESKLGRNRTNEQGYASRTIDIDILFYQGVIVNDSDLTIPHPLLHERRFVLEPLKQIDPDYVHPVMGLTIAELLDKCTDSSSVVQLGSIMNEI